MAKKLGCVPFGRLMESVKNPERTAYRYLSGSPFSDCALQEWPNRESMAKSIRMQERRERKSTDWIAVVKLTETEGY